MITTSATYNTMTYDHLRYLQYNTLTHVAYNTNT